MLQSRLIPQLMFTYMYLYIKFQYVWLEYPLQLGGLQIIVEHNLVEVSIFQMGKNVEVKLTEVKKSIAHNRNKSIFTLMKQVPLNYPIKAYCNHHHYSSPCNTLWLTQTQRKRRVPLQGLPNQ